MRNASLLLLGVISFKQTMRLAKRSAIRSLISLDRRDAPGIEVRFIMAMHDVSIAFRTNVPRAAPLSHASDHTGAD